MIELDPVKLPLIGRDDDAAAVRALVVQNPVVFVYGVAGVGKTALVRAALGAAAAMREIPAPVHVSLEGVTESREVIDRTARTMGVERPARGGPEAEQLVRLLASAPATVVFDDVDTESPRKLAPLVARFVTQQLSSRIVLVSRRFVSAKEVGFRAPAFAVEPLAEAQAIELVRAVEVARGRSLAADVAAATGGNPLLIHLALAGDVLGARVSVDPTEALRQAIEARRGGSAGAVLALMSAAGSALDEAEVVRAGGRGAEAAIDELRKHLIVVREGKRLSIAVPAAALVRSALGAPKPATWKALARLGDRMLAVSPNDDVAVLVAARARLEQGDPGGALLLLKQHASARAAADAARLERLLRDIAAKSPDHRLDALRLLAREQLRAADFEAARRTLDDLPRPRTREDAERVALLRAECHVRAGEPEAAQRAIDELAARRASAAPGPALALAQVQLAILRGELAKARQLAERLAPATSRSPTLEALRAVEIAASWLYEERYERTHEWITRARAAQRAAGVPLEPVVTILDVHALLGLGQVERAEEVIAREARGRPIGPMLEVALLVRRGEARRALDLGDAALSALGRRADLLFRSVVARDLARAATAVGDLARAARMLRLTEAGADEPGLATLRPLSDAGRPASRWPAATTRAPWRSSIAPTRRSPARRSSRSIVTSSTASLRGSPATIRRSQALTRRCAAQRAPWPRERSRRRRASRSPPRSSITRPRSNTRPRAPSSRSRRRCRGSPCAARATSTCSRELSARSTGASLSRLRSGMRRSSSARRSSAPRSARRAATSTRPPPRSATRCAWRATAPRHARPRGAARGAIPTFEARASGVARRVGREGRAPRGSRVRPTSSGASARALAPRLRRSPARAGRLRRRGRRAQGPRGRRPLPLPPRAARRAPLRPRGGGRPRRDARGALRAGVEGDVPPAPSSQRRLRRARAPEGQPQAVRGRRHHRPRRRALSPLGRRPRRRPAPRRFRPTELTASRRRAPSSPGVVVGRRRGRRRGRGASSPSSVEIAPRPRVSSCECGERAQGFWSCG